jgi:hypothetical protein
MSLQRKSLRMQTSILIFNPAQLKILPHPSSAHPIPSLKTATSNSSSSTVCLIGGKACGIIFRQNPPDTKFIILQYPFPTIYEKRGEKPIWNKDFPH